MGASSDARPAAAPVKGSFVEDSDSDAEPAPVTGRFGRRRLNMAAGRSCVFLCFMPLLLQLLNNCLLGVWSTKVFSVLGDGLNSDHTRMKVHKALLQLRLDY